VYSLTDYTFPDKPFMIALGTSHTAGDCDGPTYGPTSIKITAHDMIANELGLELVKIGLSGCMTADLLQATNELAHHKALNDNCKLFMLEPRLCDRTVRIPIEATMPDGVLHFYDPDSYSIELNNAQRDAFRESAKSLNHPLINENWQGHGIIETWAPEIANSKHAIVQQVSIDCRNLDSLKDNVSKLSTQPFFESMAFYGHGPLDIFNSVTMIDSIRHIVEANNVKFNWQVVHGEVASDSAKLTEKLLGKHSTLFDNYIDILDIEKTHENTCKCGHYNKQGHNQWYENTINHLR